jgi:hypothetical protein
VLLILIIGIFYIALAPGIRNLSGKPVFKQWVGKQVILQQPGLIYIYPKGHYSFYPQKLTAKRGIGYPLKYELPAGAVITIRSFKTYTNNMGSGSTTLFAVGYFLTKDGEQVPFEYAWNYEDRTPMYKDMEKLPLAIWQQPGETPVDNDF